MNSYGGQYHPDNRSYRHEKHPETRATYLGRTDIRQQEQPFHGSMPPFKQENHSETEYIKVEKKCKKQLKQEQLDKMACDRDENKHHESCKVEVKKTPVQSGHQVEHMVRYYPEHADQNECKDKTHDLRDLPKAVLGYRVIDIIIRK